MLRASSDGLVVASKCSDRWHHWISVVTDSIEVVSCCASLVIMRCRCARSSLVPRRPPTVVCCLWTVLYGSAFLSLALIFIRWWSVLVTCVDFEPLLQQALGFIIGCLIKCLVRFLWQSFFLVNLLLWSALCDTPSSSLQVSSDSWYYFTLRMLFH